VLRLDRTRLQTEAGQIQDVYMTQQSHESLIQYLSQEVNLTSSTNLYIQVFKLVDLFLQYSNEQKCCVLALFTNFNSYIMSHHFMSCPVFNITEVLNFSKF